MRFYGDCKQLMSEVYRDVVEMGILVKPKSMQNFRVEGNDDFWTKEVSSYQYQLLSLVNHEALFHDEESLRWAAIEFDERVDRLAVINPGKAWEIRKDIWAKFLVDGKFDYTYNERFHKFDSLYRIIEELKSNPDSRQCVLSIYDKEDILYIGGKKRIPCSMYYNFQLRYDPEVDSSVLNLIYHQRSADVVKHFGNDIYLAWCLKEWVADKVGVNGGSLIHSIDSLHAYKEDWGKLEELRTSLNKI